MNFRRFSILAAIATACLAAPVYGQGRSDVSGNWQLMLPPPAPPGGRQARQGERQQPPPRERSERDRPDGPPAVTLSLEQRGETLTGTAEFGDNVVPIENGTIRGDMISLTFTMTAPDGREHVLRLRGVLDENGMHGTMAGEPPREERRERGPEWRAERVTGNEAAG